MKNIFKLFSLLMILLATMVACEEESPWYSEGAGDGAAYVQFGDTSWALEIFLDADGNPVTDLAYPIFVRLIGPAQKSDVTVKIKVNSSTGASGEWSIANMTMTIPAGSLSASTMVAINKDATVLDSTYVIELGFDEAGTTLPVYGNIASTAKVTVTKGLACLYAQADIIGSYHFVSADWATEGDATITADADNKYTVYVSGLEVVEGLVEDKGPLKMVIGSKETSPNNFPVTVDKQILVTDVSAWGYADLYYAGDGNLNTCTYRYDMTFEIGVSVGNWGDNGFVFTKN
jgi:hypothetical protein